MLIFVVVLYTIAYIFSANIPISFLKEKYNVTCKFKMEKFAGNLSLIYFDVIEITKEKNKIVANIRNLNKTIFCYTNLTCNFKDPNNLVFIPEALLRKINGFWMIKNKSFVVTNKIEDVYFIFYIKDGLIKRELVIKEKPTVIISLDCS